ncbi:MAG: Leucine-rich repeat (LRR) protein, partial [Nonlabens sp.]
STNNFKEVFLTEELIKGYNENLVLVYNKNLVRYRLQTYEGKILWETPVGAWTITNNLVEALKYKKEVRRYELLSEDDFSNGLFELKDLEELKISFAKVEELPSEIAKLKKLKKLTIEWMRQLKTLPKELGELKKLEYLVVKNCEAYQGGLEDIIAQLPNLKKVELEGITLDKVFKAKLKTTRPDLIIVEEEVIFEDMMIEEY